jgi:hypothetical protein
MSEGRLSMSADAEWPAFQLGPRESVFAIGVASVKCVELESVLYFLFATTFGMHTDDATMIVAKVGTEAATGLMRQRLLATEWDEKTQDAIGHFLKAFGICAYNRNQLMHSNLAWSSDATLFFQTTKQGRTKIANPTLAKLRRVAEDINTYVLYGRSLGNAINAASADVPIPANAFPWPEKPALPEPLDYSSESRPITKN